MLSSESIARFQASDPAFAWDNFRQIRSNFNFCTIWGLFDGQVGFFSSTEEGALWVGTIGADQHLNVLGYQTVFGSLGSALAFNGQTLVVTNYNLYEFTTPSARLIGPGQNPERLPLTLLPAAMSR